MKNKLLLASCLSLAIGSLQSEPGSGESSDSYDSQAKRDLSDQARKKLLSDLMAVKINKLNGTDSEKVEAVPSSSSLKDKEALEQPKQSVGIDMDVASFTPTIDTSVTSPLLQAPPKPLRSKDLEANLHQASAKDVSDRLNADSAFHSSITNIDFDKQPSNLNKGFDAFNKPVSAPESNNSDQGKKNSWFLPSAKSSWKKIKSYLGYAGKNKAVVANQEHLAPTKEQSGEAVKNSFDDRQQSVKLEPEAVSVSIVESEALIVVKAKYPDLTNQDVKNMSKLVEKIKELKFAVKGQLMSPEANDLNQLKREMYPEGMPEGTSMVDLFNISKTLVKTDDVVSLKSSQPELTNRLSASQMKGDEALVNNMKQEISRPKLNLGAIQRGAKLNKTETSDQSNLKKEPSLIDQIKAGVKLKKNSGTQVDKPSGKAKTMQDDLKEKLAERNKVIQVEELTVEDNSSSSFEEEFDAQKNIDAKNKEDQEKKLLDAQYKKVYENNKIIVDSEVKANLDKIKEERKTNYLKDDAQLRAQAKNAAIKKIIDEQSASKEVRPVVEPVAVGDKDKVNQNVKQVSKIVKFVKIQNGFNVDMVEKVRAENNSANEKTDAEKKEEEADWA